MSDPYEIALTGVRQTCRVMRKNGGTGLFVFAAKGDFREKVSPWFVKGCERREVAALFKRGGFKKIYIDECLTTRQNGKYKQKEWLVTVFK